MRIGINTLALLDTMAGAERYTQNVIRALAQIDSLNQYFIFLTPVNEKYYQIDKENFENVIVNFSNRNRFKRILYEQIFLPSLLNKKKIDILFSPNNISPFGIGCLSALMIFDLHWLKFMEFFDISKRIYIKNMIKLSARKANVILTLSRSSKNDIVKFLGISPKDIVVTYSGAFSYLQENNLTENFINSLPDSYILCVCQLHKRKNIIRLIKAYNILKEHYAVKQKLLIVGRPGDGQEEIYKEYNNSPYKNDIKILGYIEDGLIRTIYSRADILAYPSLYEGFGIPVLEAMISRVPIVASYVSSLPEVAGNAAVYVNPYSEESIAKGIYEVLNDKAKRTKIIERGIKSASRFNWLKTAYITRQAFENLGKNK